MNTYDRAVDQIVNHLSDEDMLLVIKTKRLLDNGHFDRQYQNAVFYPFRSKPTLADAYAFAKIHAALCRGQIARALIKIGHSPFADADVEANDAALKSLPYPFSGSFIGGKADYDGNLSWAKPIRMDAGAVDEPDRYVFIPPKTIPLEVGYTSAPTTLAHLSTSRALARWAYESEFIYLWVVTDLSWQVGADTRYSQT